MKLIRIDRSSRGARSVALLDQHDRLASLVGLTEWSVEYALVEDQEMQELNRQFRDKNAVTDVLSFGSLLETGDGTPVLAAGQGGAFHDLWLDPIDGAVSEMGQIIMAPAFIEDRCAERGWDPDAELLLLMAHGLLHLLGWDHQDDASRRAMVARETELLAHCGIPHPIREGEGE
jgi:probable rRNA maturation factor